MSPEVFSLSQTPITAHAFSADRKGSLNLYVSTTTFDLSPDIAVSLNSNDVQLYTRKGSDWTPTETLSEVLSDIRRLFSWN